MIWNQEKIDPQDISYITKCKILGIRSIVKRKFHLDLTFGSSELIA